MVEISMSGSGEGPVWATGRGYSTEPPARLILPKLYSWIPVQELGIAPPSGFPALPESPQGEYSIGCLAQEASTDRSSFEANNSLTFKEAASSIDD